MKLNRIFCGKKNDFFNPDTLARLLTQISQNNHQARLRQSLTEKPKIAYTSFHYLNIPIDENILTLAYSEIESNLSEIPQLSPGEAIRTYDHKRSQIFMKGFSKGSHYDLHTEDANLFGHAVYLVYLSDESSSEIQFPSNNDLNHLCKKEELENWQNMQSVLKNNGTDIIHSPRTHKFMPKVNKCIAFKTGLVHRVTEFPENYLGRYCLTGFPFASIHVTINAKE